MTKKKEGYKMCPFTELKPMTKKGSSIVRAGGIRQSKTRDFRKGEKLQDSTAMFVRSGKKESRRRDRRVFKQALQDLCVEELYMMKGGDNHGC